VARLERIREERGFIFDELSREFREGLLSQAIEDDLRAALDGLDRSLREAFESIGIDLGDPPERIASQIASSRVATSILLALDQWVTLLDLRPDADPKMEEKLFRTAQLADPDAWRWDLRRAQREKDLAALRALADGDEIRRQAPSTLESLAFTFRRLGDPERERSVLVLCQRLHPDDFWINARLGKVFLEAKRFDEALLFVMVAVALRPASGYAHRLLALAYLGKGNIEGAVEAFRKDIALAPGSFRSYYSLSQILERGAKAVGSAALDEIIRTLEGIAASGEAFHTDGLIRLLAEALFLQGEKARAILALEESLRVPGIQHGSFTTPAGYDLSHAQILARYRAAGEPARAERVLCDLLGRADMRYRAVWNLWLAISFADLGRSPAETRAVIPAPGVAAAIDHPRSPIRVASEYEADVRWLLDRLESGGPICINAGGDDYVCATGALWCRDRFFTAGGTTYLHGRGRMLDDIAGTEDDPIFQTERWFAPNPCGPIGYEIPLPPGAYTVALHFAEVYAPEKRQPAGHERAFDVLIQGKAVLSNYGPLRKGFAAADRWTFPAIVRDGILSIEFVHRVENPKISGLEIVRAP